MLRPATFREARLSVSPHLSQERLAAAAGITKGTYASLESGKAENCTIKTLLAIQKALVQYGRFVPIGDFIQGEVYTVEAAPAGAAAT